MKKILLVVLIGMLLMMPLVMAKTAPQKLPTIKPWQKKDLPSSSQPTISEDIKTRVDYGSSLFTKYGWDGKSCVKRDLFRRPVLAIDPITRKVMTDSQGNYLYKMSIIDGERALAWNPKIMKPDLTLYGCDVDKIETEPLPISWWIKEKNKWLE